MKILLIEDSVEITKGVSLIFKLRWPDATVLSSFEGERGIRLAEEESPDIIILDINLPDMIGFDVLEGIRSFSDVPVIILTVRDDEIDELKGLELGADDYIVKPFSPAALLSRVRAVLRRVGVHDFTEETSLPSLAFGNIVVNFQSGEVMLDSTLVHLTPNERKIFYCLARNEGKLVTQEALRKQVWGAEARYIDKSVLKRYIYQLRSKLGDNDQSPQFILNERGIGYRLASHSHVHA